MKKAKIDSQKAFELIYELFKAKPWLNSAGVLTSDDHHFEDEALAFLLTLERADGWGMCSEPACRVANSLLLDFIAKLHGPLSQETWFVPDSLPPWRQAAKIICAEIHKSHPHLSKPN
ncbi:MAG: hypothetical protein C4518_05915 [Desulfobacteraceae bacterium]|nr:MAG: hypothetical protein C4518_05915 [Desulfobacteraceae bacterium]